MVKMGLQQPDRTEKWSHPPKKKWIYNYLADDEGGEEGGEDEGVKREVVVQRAADNLTRAAPPPAPHHHPHNNHHHNHHHHHHHHHHHSSNHRGVGPNSPPPAPRTAPTSPAHARDEPPQPQRRVPALSTPTLGVRGSVSGQQQGGGQHHTSPRTSLSYPGSPAASPSPLGLLSVFRQESSSPPSSSSSTGDTSSLPSRLGPDTPHQQQQQQQQQQQHQPGSHLHNGLAKSLALSPAHHSSFSHHGLYSPDDPAFKDDKKRSGSTPSREVHNKLEKNRRAHLKECFETLRRQLPSMDDKKISNQTILKAAHKHIQSLKRKEREYEHEMERLAREKIAHQQKLSALKKELSARWDHIDFNALLPDMASLDQHRDKETKSTTTASEQPDLEDDARDAGTQVSPASPRLHPEPPTRPAPPAPNTTMADNGPGVAPPRDQHFTDPNQPLNLSTSMVEPSRAPQLVSQSGRSPHHTTDWGTQQPYQQPTFTTATGAAGEEAWQAVEVSSAPASATRDTVTTVAGDHLSIMSGTAGIHLPAHLVAGGVQLNGAPGGLLGQPAIQVITPEGYKLLPADHAPNGAKPLTITLAHPATTEGLDRGDNSEDAKTGTATAAPMMVAFKNGMQALHLTVPTTPRTLPHTQGTNGTITTVPLNLSVGGTAAAVKVTQAATSSLLPSYLPITHANGITQLVSGLGNSMGTLVSGIGPPIVTPLVVSQPQRVGVPGTVTTVGSKGLKAATVGGNATSVPLVSTQYTTSLGSGLGGLVKPVVVVSAPTGIVTGAHAVASGKP